MPGFSNLSAAQISDIVIFLHNQAEEALHSNGVPRDYPIKKLLTGNADAGKAYFNGAGGCTACHSVTGDLAHVGQKYQPEALQNRFVWPAGGRGGGGGGGRGGRGPQITVTLANGKTVVGALKHIDD